MATTSAVVARIDELLDAVLAEIRDLPNVVTEWDQLSDAARVSIALDWEHLLVDYVSEIERCHKIGCMTAAQEKRFQTLQVEIRSSLPAFSRLGLLPLVTPPHAG